MDNIVCNLRKPTKLKAAKSPKRKPPYHHHKTTVPTAADNDKTAVKVVYISNPMWVKATASEFRSLVQELTGQDSDPPIHYYATDISNPVETIGVGVGDATSKAEDPLGVEEQAVGGGSASSSPAAHCPESMTSPHDNPAPDEDAPTSSGTFDEECSDEVFTPQMLDTLEVLCPSALLYGSFSEFSSFAMLSHRTVVPPEN